MKVKGRVKLLRALPYKDCMYYIRQIGLDFFEWLVVFEKEIYTSYILISPPEGKTKLPKKSLQGVITMLVAGAEATIDTLKERKKDNEKQG